MKNLQRHLVSLNNPQLKTIALLGMFVTLLLMSNYVLAADLLAGTDTDLKDTLKGTGRNWILIIDGIAAALMFMTRKNVIVLGSVIVITIFINLLLFLAK